MTSYRSNKNPAYQDRFPELANGTDDSTTFKNINLPLKHISARCLTSSERVCKSSDKMFLSYVPVVSTKKVFRVKEILLVRELRK